MENTDIRTGENCGAGGSAKARRQASIRSLRLPMLGRLGGVHGLAIWPGESRERLAD